MPENYPTSANAATERHAHANSDEEDLSNTTKDLTQGTEDDDNGNVGRQDLRTNAEALAQGTSPNCAETTPVVLESTLPHKLQKQLQDSLQATPYACKQEVADSIVTAGCTNGMAEMAKPTIAGVDRTALLGGKLAERACGVDKGDETECDPQTRLQQIEFYCEEKDQHSRNATGDIPSIQKLPLEGEWTVLLASGKASDLEGDADASNEPTELLTTKVELPVKNGSDVPRVCLGAMCWHACNVEGPGNRVDGLSCETDVSSSQAGASRGQTDAPSGLNNVEAAVVSHSNGPGMYLATGDVKRGGEKTDGIKSHADASSGHLGMSSVKTDALTTENETDIISIP